MTLELPSFVSQSCVSIFINSMKKLSKAFKDSTWFMLSGKDYLFLSFVVLSILINMDY